MTEPPTDSLVTPLRQELQAIATGLEVAAGPAERAALKRRIIALFKRTEVTLGELARFKEEIRVLVEKYKRLSAEPPATPPSAQELHQDHLGASTFVDKGWSLIASGDHGGAIQTLHRALELAPGDLKAQSLLGWAQMLSAQYPEALATFSQVLLQEPANSLARVNVGYICLKRRVFGEAIEHLSRVIRLDNDRKATLYAHYYLGLVYLERGMYLDAQSFLEKALALGPNLIEAYYDLGRALWFAGRHDAAKEAWGKGAGTNRLAPWGKKCQELLEVAERGGEVPRS